MSQLKQITKINIKRQQIANFYNKGLQKYQQCIKLPEVPPDSLPNWHIYAILFKEISRRNIFLRKMRQKGIDVAYHYVPLHLSGMGRKLKGSAMTAEGLPVTEYVWERLIRLPIYPGLTGKQLLYITKSARDVLSA